MAALESFPNAGLIWTPQQLKERLGDENLVILDMRPSHEIMTGIIPGAAHFDLYGVHLAQTTAELMREYIDMMRSQMGHDNRPTVCEPLENLSIQGLDTNSKSIFIDCLDFLEI